MIELSRILGEEIQQISGVNEELLGSAIDDKAGILSMLRQGAGLTTLQILFDQLDHSKKLLGRLFIDLIQSNFTPGKISRIIGEEPSREFFSKAFGKYDSAVEEGVYTTTQRQVQFRQLIELRELGINIPEDLLVKSSTIQGKKELLEALAAQKEQEQKQLERSEAIAEQEKNAIIEDVRARAQANLGLGLERASRVQENRALAIERLAESQKDKNLSSLAIVKAAKELEGLDLEHLNRLISLAKSLQELGSSDNIEERAEVKEPSLEELLVALQQGENNGNE